MSETTNTTKQFLDKDGLNALWDKICSVFASKQELEDLGNVHSTCLLNMVS